MNVQIKLEINQIAKQNVCCFLEEKDVSSVSTRAMPNIQR